MDDEEASAQQLYANRVRDGPCPVGMVNVAANGSDRCDFGKARNNLSFADVACVDDVRNPFKDRDSFGAKQSMRIRDDSDHRHLRIVPRLAKHDDAPADRITQVPQNVR